MTLAPVPSLDELVGHPGRIGELSVPVARDLLAQVIGLQTALLAHALSASSGGNGRPEAPAEADRLLTPEEAARLLGVEVSWLSRHRRRLPFARKLSHKTVRYSEAGLRKWQALKRA